MPSHVKESVTVAIVVRSLLAADRSNRLFGVLVGWVVARRELDWPVVSAVVVAVDMGFLWVARWVGMLRLLTCCCLPSFQR